jgi:hypothetical protein
MASFLRKACEFNTQARQRLSRQRARLIRDAFNRRMRLRRPDARAGSRCGSAVARFHSCKVLRVFQT